MSVLLDYLSDTIMLPMALGYYIVFLYLSGWSGSLFIASFTIKE